ncbi:hypothetical protein KUTeg_006688 [Tegillarca granosa]|uniref:Uncharacterized protein n=1 Tax=Tegillarca granosa TaxID=220873 RepID=A0ABQ9FB13_TEGGR|nr:hypothetical protein KUTeg_006688 [Tegillarca granosa]
MILCLFLKNVNSPNMLSQKEADDILFNSELEEGDAARDKRMASVPKDLRQFLIRENPESDDAKSAAAIEIQRTYRGFRARTNLFQTLVPNVSDTAQYGGSQHVITRVEDADEELEKVEKALEPVSEELGQEYSDYLMQMQKSGIPSSEILTYEQFSLKENQEWWDKRKQTSSKVSQHSQDKEVPQQKRRIPPSERAAAIMIQRAWRRHIERFPPNIYYKIFTHRPIQDMCSNSPKDYTKPVAKLLMMKDVHNNFRDVPRVDCKEGWYRREDNNGWRLVSDRLIHHVMSDPVTWETSHKKYEFNHDKVKI